MDVVSSQIYSGIIWKYLLGKLSKLFKEENPEIIALQFYGPILLLFQQYDCNPENEDQIKDYLNKHIKAFGENYRRKV